MRECRRKIKRRRWRRVEERRRDAMTPHCGPESPRILIGVLGHSLVHSLIRALRSLVRLLCPTRFARVLCCAHLLAGSLAHFAHSLARGTVIDSILCFFFYSGPQVLQWMQFADHELLPPVCSWVFPLIGVFQSEAKTVEKAKEECLRILKVIDDHLLFR